METNSLVVSHFSARWSGCHQVLLQSALCCSCYSVAMKYCKLLHSGGQTDNYTLVVPLFSARLCHALLASCIISIPPRFDIHYVIHLLTIVILPSAFMLLFLLITSVDRVYYTGCPEPPGRLL